MDHSSPNTSRRRRAAAAVGAALAFTLVTSVAVPSIAFASPETAASAVSELDAKRATSTAYSVQRAEDAIAVLSEVHPDDIGFEAAAQIDVDNAMANLVSTKGLSDAIAAAQAKLSGDYAADSKNFLAAHLAPAEDLLALTANAAVEVKSDSIDVAVNNLAIAQAGLVDLSGLRAAVAAESERAAQSHTANSWAVFTGAQGGANVVLANDAATQSDVSSALTMFGTAVGGLVDISAARSDYDAFLISHPEEDYTAASRPSMRLYKSIAVTLFANGADPSIAVTQADINDVADFRRDMLGWIVQISGLRDSVAVASALNGADYTAASRNAMYGALSTGSAILVRAEIENQYVARDEIVDATQVLDGYVARLVNIAALSAKYGEADHLVEGDYLAASWPAFYDARELAGDLLMDAADFGKTVTDADVTAAVSNLTSAMGALEGIDGLIASAEVELSAATDVLDNVGATYTAHSVAQLQAAVDRLADAIGNRVEAELNAASSASATARNSLVGASSFNSIYDLGVGYNEADFSAASWVPLAAWLVAAQPIHESVSDPTAAVSQATLDASANAGWSLMVDLVQTRDVANLRRVLNTYTGQLLTGQSAARLAAALDTADDLLLRATDSSDVITYAEVYVAIDALHDAYNGFVYTNDAVLRLNNYAEWFHASDFTASSATALTSALTTLNSLAYGDATTTVTAAQLADAVAAVDSAGAGLVSIEWLRNTLGSIDLPEFEAAFSASSFGPFAAAITAARAFLARAADPLVTITGAEVDSVTDSLFDTAMALVYVADLNDAVASNAGLVQSQYTAASWAVFATALADAQAIAARASDGATATPVGQDEVHDAVQALLNAAAALVAAPPLVEGPKTDTSAKMTAALPRTGGSDPLVPAGGALALMLAGAGLMAVRRRGQVTDS